MNKFIPYSHQYIDQEDINAVIKVLKSDFITQGPKIEEFEKLLADYCSAKYAVVLSSGTSALHSAYYVGGIKEGDELITSPITFLATANAGLFLGAKPVFVDVEPDTGNINPDLIEENITTRTKVIIPVHYGGHPVDLEKIAAIAEKHNLLVIEDASHALGAKYKGKEIGNCRYSDMSIFSFHPVKSITTGEGGAVLTNNKDYYEKLVMFRQHGVTKDLDKFVNKDLAFTLNSHPSRIPKAFGSRELSTLNFNPWYYEMQILGYNYRMTDIQAALGISQLKKLNKFVEKRRVIVKGYEKAFKNNPYFDIPVEKGYAYSSYHLYPIRLKDEYKNKKKEIFLKLRGKRIGTQVHYIPVYWQPYYQELGYKKGICPNAEDFYQREISMPIYHGINNKDITYVINTILKIFEYLK